MLDTLKKKSAIALAWDFFGLIINRGSGFVISIFLARLLSPAEFGLVGMAAVFITISQVFIDVGFTSALIQNKDNSDIVYSSVFFFNISAGLILTISFFLISPLIGGFYGNSEVTSIVQWLSLSFIFNSFSQVQTAILHRALKFKELTIRNIVASSLGGAFGIIAAYHGLGVYSLIIQSVTSTIIGTILLWKLSKWKPKFEFSFKELKRLLDFSFYVFLDGIISTIFTKLDVMIIAKVFSPSILGYYSRAVSLKDQVTVYSTSSIQKVFFPILSSLRKEKLDYEKVYFKVISVVVFISFGLTGVLYILGKFIILGLFGLKWSPSVEIFQVLILSVCNYPLNSMMVNAFLSNGLSKENFRIGILRKCIKVIPFLMAFYYGIYEFTIALVVVSYIVTIVNILFLKYFLKMSFLKHLKKMIEGLIPLLLFILIFNFFHFKNFKECVFLSLAFICIYILFNFSIKTEGFVFIKDNLFKIFNQWKQKRK